MNAACGIFLSYQTQGVEFLSSEQKPERKPNKASQFREKEP